MHFKSLLVVGVLLFPAFASCESSFSSALSPEESASVGLSKLTEEERARLDTLVDAYKYGELQKAKAKAVAAEQKLKDVQAERKASADSKTVNGAVVIKPGTNVVVESVESRILGEFSGWNDRTLIRLENGTRWQTANKGDTYEGDVLQNPRVTIKPASTGAFWMEVDGIKRRVRVKPYTK